MRRFRRYPAWPIWVCCLGVCAILGRYLWDLRVHGPSATATGKFPATSIQPGGFELVRIERADLLVIRQQVAVLGHAKTQHLEARLKLLGVQSSDVGDGAVAEEGRRFTEEFLSQGPATLELDRRRLDEEGNFLAYVYVGDELLNAQLIRAGLAKAEIYPGDNQSVHATLVKAEKEARAAQRGMWQADLR